jgi:hypothetical protein
MSNVLSQSCHPIKTCVAPRRQGHHPKLLPLLQLRSEEKVRFVQYLHLPTNLILALIDDECVSPTKAEDDLGFKSSKRARTHSPDSIRRETAAKLKERARTRMEEFTRRMNAEREARRDARDQALMEDIIAEIPEEYIWPNGTATTS